MNLLFQSRKWSFFRKEYRTLTFNLKQSKCDMKILFLFCLLSVFALTSKAQYGGELTIGARANYVGAGRVLTSDGKWKNLGYTLKGVISPSYFIWNSLAVGANLGYEHLKDDLGHQYTLEAFPFLRYYTPHSDVRFFMQLEGGYGWGESFMKAGHDGQHKLWAATWKPGIFARIKDYMAIEVSVMSLEYKKVWMTDKDTRYRITSSGWRYNWLDVSFGVAFIIGL